MSFLRRIILILLAAAASALADVETGFELPQVSGSPPGMVLTGQDGWYNPLGGSADLLAFTYSGNAYGLANNPNGGSQFIAGQGQGNPVNAVAERSENFAGGEVWTISVDVAARYLGIPPASNELGGFSLEDTGVSRSFAGTMTWTNPANPTTWRLGYLVYDATGAPVAQPGLFAGAAWQSLQANRWYRISTTFSLAANRIVSVSIRDILAGTTATVHPSGWYLAGGSSPSQPPPTALRLLAGGSNSGNITAWDNLDICPLQVTGFNPPAGQEGTLVQINGCGFGERADDLSVSIVMPDGTLIPMTVLSTTNTQIDARLGPVPPDAQPGQIVVGRGLGQRGINSPGLDDVIPENPSAVLVIDRAGLPVSSPGQFTPIPTLPPPGEAWLFGRHIPAGQVEIDIDGVWQPNTSLRIYTKLHSVLMPVGADVEAAEIRLRCGGDGLYLAERIADAVQTAYANRGINTSIMITSVGTGTWRLTATLLDQSLVMVPADLAALNVVATEPSLVSPFAIGPVTGFHQSTLTQPGFAAQVNNVDLSGEDGATISPLIPTPTGVVSHTLPIPLDQSGESVTIRAWGTFTGPVSNQLIGSARLLRAAGAVSVQADFAGSATGFSRVEVWNCTAMTASLVVPNGLVAQIVSAGTGLPEIVGAGARPQVGPAAPFLWIDLDRAVQVTPTGSLPAIGNQLRLYADVAGVNVTAIQAFDIAAGLADPGDVTSYTIFNSYEGGICYANCDGSSGSPRLTANDFACYVNLYASGDARANCDGSVGAVTLTPNDFACFLNQFANSCP